MEEEESKEDIFFEKQTMECAFMQENSEIIIETCMMVYCSLSYAVCKRYDLIQIFEDILHSHFDFIMSQNSVLLKVRIC